MPEENEVAEPQPESPESPETPDAAEPQATGAEAAAEASFTEHHAATATVDEPQPGSPEAAQGDGNNRNLDLILDVRVPLTVHLGSAEMEIRDVLELGNGSIVELDKLAGEPVDIYVRGRLLARGEVIVIDESFGVRITAICNPEQRVNTLR